ncbi:hypothetical protein [Pseudooceanicola algae]|uniref:Uncharacterized protein n=1 Tax=Pseudooceanicola algae TaxID=1537215 RepID=A0A418SD69_9RHOB|nr:hypothetical protein [Pseudooceanicola algae]QPM92556.1 hypothetical protein PSAL_038200 [Pseudooceanicola algae]
MVTRRSFLAGGAAGLGGAGLTGSPGLAAEQEGETFLREYRFAFAAASLLAGKAGAIPPRARLSLRDGVTGAASTVYADGLMSQVRDTPMIADDTGDLGLCCLADGLYDIVLEDAAGEQVLARRRLGIRTAFRHESAGSFQSLADLLEDRSLGYQADATPVDPAYRQAWPGAVVQVAQGGFSYVILPPEGGGAAHLVTVGGVRMQVQPDPRGRYPLAAFPGDADTALSLALESGPVLLEEGHNYRLSRGITLRDRPVTIIGNGARLLRTAGAENRPVLDISFSLSDPVPVRDLTRTRLWAGHPVTRLTSGKNFTSGDRLDILGQSYRFTEEAQAKGTAGTPGANPDRTLRGGPDRDRLVPLAPSLPETLDNLAEALKAGGQGRVHATREGDDALDVTAWEEVVSDGAWQFDSTAPAAEWKRQFSPTTGSRITLDPRDVTALGLQVGDVVKIVSDDPIPWSQAKNREYVGETFRIDALEDGRHLFSSQPLAMHAHLRSNPRLVRLTDQPVLIEDLEISDAPEFDPQINSPHILLTGAVRPRLRNVGTQMGAAGHLELLSCYKARTEGVYGANLRTSTAKRYNAFGYVLIEYACTGGVHTGLYGARCRHVYTTGARGLRDLPGTDLTRYGGVIGAEVEGVGDDCEHYAFDTHPDALGCRFDVKVRPGYRGMLASLFGVQLRGQDHVLRADVTAQSCLTVGVYGTGTGGHQIKMTFRRPDNGAGEKTPVLRFTSTSTDRASCRLSLEAQVEGYAGSLMHVDGVDLVCPDLTLSYAPTEDARAAALFYPQNCRIECAALDWDMAGTRAHLPRLVRQMGPDGRVIIDRARIRNAPRFLIGDLGNEPGAEVRIADLLSEDDIYIGPQSEGFDLFVNRVPGSRGGAAVRRLTDRSPAPGFLTFLSRTATRAEFFWQGRLDPVIHLVAWNLTGQEVRISALSPPAFDGQKLQVTLPLTPPPDTTAKKPVAGYLLQSGQSLSPETGLAPGQGLTLIGYHGSWLPG